MKALFAACHHQRDKRLAALSSAILHILCYTGLRRAELLALELADVDMIKMTLHVRHGKGDKARLLPLNQVCYDALQAWLNERQKMVCRHTHLWAHDRGRAVGEESLMRLLEDVKHIAGLGHCTNIKPHSLRHWFATNASRVPGSNLKDVQMLLGHASISTTAIYLHSDIEQMRKVMLGAALSEDEEETPLPTRKAAPTSASPQGRKERPTITPAPAASTTRPASRRVELRPAVPVKPSRFQRQDLRRVPASQNTPAKRRRLS